GATSGSPAPAGWPPPRRPPRSATRRTRRCGRSLPRARRAPRRSSGPPPPCSLALLHRGDELLHQLAVGRGVVALPDQFGGGGERELHRLAPELLHRAVALA